MRISLIETTTKRTIYNTEQSIYDDNKDIIWPTVVGIFVALALGWMICRYKCSSNERSPHIVQCCPKSLCKRIRLCCIYMFEFKSNPQQRRRQQQQQQSSISDLRMATIRDRSSNNSILEIPFLSNSVLNSRPSITQWPPPFLLNYNNNNNNNTNQGSSLPLSINIPSLANTLEPKRHPLRRESLLPEAEQNDERRDSSPWPFLTTNMIFHKQTNEIKKNHLFFST